MLISWRLEGFYMKKTHTSRWHSNWGWSDPPVSAHLTDSPFGWRKCVHSMPRKATENVCIQDKPREFMKNYSVYDIVYSIFTDYGWFPPALTFKCVLWDNCLLLSVPFYIRCIRNICLYISPNFCRCWSFVIFENMDLNCLHHCTMIILVLS